MDWQASSVSPASSACGFAAPPPTTASSSAVTLCSTGYGFDGRLCPRDTSNGPCPSGCAASSGSGATPTAAPRTTPIAPPPVHNPLSPPARLSERPCAFRTARFCPRGRATSRAPCNVLRMPWRCHVSAHATGPPKRALYAQSKPKRVCFAEAASPTGAARYAFFPQSSRRRS
jgi:hypothetical protein